ncbi:hypothetical protein ACLOJK_041597 [Asimina triloba]
MAGRGRWDLEFSLGVVWGFRRVSRVEFRVRGIRKQPRTDVLQCRRGTRIELLEAFSSRMARLGSTFPALAGWALPLDSTGTAGLGLSEADIEMRRVEARGT